MRLKGLGCDSGNLACDGGIGTILKGRIWHMKVRLGICETGGFRARDLLVEDELISCYEERMG